MPDAEIRGLAGVTMGEKSNLIRWRDELIDDLRENDIFVLIDEFNQGNEGRGFKKTCEGEVSVGIDKVFLE
jgi:hypothetical protein